VLSRDQLATFDSQGLLRLAGAIAPETVEAMASHVWSMLNHSGLYRDDPASWRQGRPRGLQRPARSGELNGMGSDAVRGAVDDLLGRSAWEDPEHWGQLLISLPEDREWRLPHRAWHLDLPERAAVGRRPGVQIFAFLEPLETRGGATVAIRGSHHLVEKALHARGGVGAGASADVRQALGREHGWLAALWRRDDDGERERRFMSAPTEVEDARLQVVELTGDAGDVILMHPYVFHAPSPNASSRPRVVATQRIYAAP